MNRKLTIPAVALGLGLGLAGLSPAIANAAAEPAAPVLSAKITSINVANGTAKLIGTVDETTNGYISVNGDVVAAWSPGHELTNHRWSATVKGLVAGQNTLSVEQFAKTLDGYGNRVSAHVADTTSLTASLGTGTGFTAIGTKNADDSYTVSGTADPASILTIEDTKSHNGYSTISPDADGHYSVTIPNWAFARASVDVESTGPAGELTRSVPVGQFGSVLK